MSAIRSAASECVFCLFSRTSRRQVVSSARRPFHSSPIHQKRKPRFPSVKATPTSTQVDLERAARDFAASSAGQQDGAATKQYTPEQQAAIEAARKLIDPEQLAKQTGMRTDPWQVKYYDDLTKIDPVVDKPVRAPWTNIDDASRLKSPEEFEQDLLKLMHDIPTPKNDNDYDPAIWDKFDRSLRLTVGREEAERRPRTALAPDLPKISPPAEKRKTTRGRDGEMVAEEEPSPSLVRLMQMTGYNRKQLAGLRVKTIVQHGVANQTRLGKVRKSWFLTVAGNGQGLIGVGEGKGVEMEEARLQSQYRAIRDMKPILRYEDRTIFGDVDAKVSATELELYARPPGFGLRCQRYIWEICKCAGISDLGARVTRARNPMNTVKATVRALLSQKHPEDVARGRGKKMVDVRKVYYAGET